MLPHVVEHRRLQSTKAEVQRISFHFRRTEFHRSSRTIRSRGQPIQNRSSGIAQPKQLRDFVVRFPGGIVPRLPDLAITQEYTRILHVRSEEHTSELQSQSNLVCRLLLEKKKITNNTTFLSSGSTKPNPYSLTYNTQSPLSNSRFLRFMPILPFPRPLCVAPTSHHT